jgi:hypothetical protein
MILLLIDASRPCGPVFEAIDHKGEKNGAEDAWSRWLFQNIFPVNLGRRDAWTYRVTGKCWPARRVDRVGALRIQGGAGNARTACGIPPDSFTLRHFPGDRANDLRPRN